MTEFAKIKVQAITKAIQDENFRAELLRDAHQAVQKGFGFDIPQGKSLHVVEQHVENQTFIVPKKPAEITDNMDENEIIARLTKGIPQVSDQVKKIMDV